MVLEAEKEIEESHSVFAIDSDKVMRVNSRNSAYHPQFQQVCGLIVFKNFDCEKVDILLMEKNYMLQIPSGLVQMKENFETACVRAFEEVTGCENSDVLEIDWKRSLIDEYKDPAGTLSNVYYFFACLPENVELTLLSEKQAQDIQLVEFYTIDELNNDQLEEREIYLLDHIKDYIRTEKYRKKMEEEEMRERLKSQSIDATREEAF